MPKKKNSKKQKPPIDSLALRIYGVWSKKENKFLSVNLSQEAIEFEFDLEGYDDKNYLIICLDAVYDASNLGRSTQ